MVAAELVRASADLSARARQHRSSSLRAVTDLDLTGIIFTATKDERAELASVNPALRSRAFTVKEAIALGSAPARPDELSALPIATDAVRFASFLNGRRGTIQLPPRAQRKWRWKATREDALDIPDDHRSSARAHVSMLKGERALAEDLATRFSAFVTESRRAT